VAALGGLTSAFVLAGLRVLASPMLLILTFLSMGLGGALSYLFSKRKLSPASTQRLMPETQPSEVRPSKPKEVPLTDVASPPIPAVPAGGAPRFRWKEILAYVAAILAVNVIGVGAARGLRSDAVVILGIILLQIGVFTLSGSRIERKKWAHLLIVAALGGLTSAFALAGLFGFLPILLILTFLSMGLGGALSYLFSKRKLSPDSV